MMSNNHNQQNDIVFHLLDIQTRDAYITNENETSKELVFESADEYSDPECQQHIYRKKKSKNYFKGKREYTIHLFGSMSDGRSVRVDVTGYRPYFYVKIPEFCVSNPQALRDLKNYVEGRFQGKQYISSEINYTIVKKCDFMGFTARQKYSFVKIDFPSISAFRECKSFFLDTENKPFLQKKIIGSVWKDSLPDIYEANIDPMLRFLHDRNINPCNWIRIANTSEYFEQIQTKKLHEILQIDATSDDIFPSNAPSGIAIAPFLKAFWDIECYSESGDFPVAKRDWTKISKDIVRACEEGTIKSGQSIHEEIMLALKGNSKIIGKIVSEPLTPKKITALERCSLNLEQLQSIYLTAKQHTAESIVIKNTADKLHEFYSTRLGSGLCQAIELRGDPVIQIGTVLTRGTSNIEPHLFSYKTCSDIPGTTVHSFNSEKKMIDAWFEWLSKVNPDELIGYNVFGFDEKYLWERADALGLTSENSYIHELSRLYELGTGVKLSENRLSSSALGDNFLYTWTCSGRLQVDLYFYVKRSGASLPSYKLDDVAKHYMSGKLKSAPVYLETDKLSIECSGSIRDVRSGRYIQLMDDTGESVCSKLLVESIKIDDSKSGTIICICKDLTEDEKETIVDGTRWAIVKDDVSPQDIFRLWQGSDDDRARIGGYCIQDCELVMELYRKLEVFNNSMSMANVCIVPISYIFTRGQGVKIESLIFRECAAADTLIPVLENPLNYKDGNDESYEGAIVLDPEPGLYKDSPIGVCDFASLYPSTIISENISHDMLVWVRDYNNDGDLIENVWPIGKYASLSEEYTNCKGYAYTDIEFDLLKPDPSDKRKNPEKIRCGRRICRYAQPLDGSKGLLPEIIKKLLAARKAKRKDAEREENPDRRNLLDAEQLAYKVTANSLYGQLGSKTFKIRLVYLAASVTAYARKQLLFSKECIERFYGPTAERKDCSAIIRYGDTDSVFVEVNPKNPKTGERLKGRDARQACIELTENMGHFITQALRPPHDFEFDKIFDPLLMFSKKRYAGKMYETNADDFVYKYMGIALKRRDNAPIVKTVFGTAMRELLDKNDVAGAAAFVQTQCNDLVEGKICLGQLTITKSLRAEYANASGVAHKVLADRMAARDPGNAPAAGDRIPYIYILPPPGQVPAKLQGERIETPQWVRSHNLNPDYAFYITNQIQNPICEMFAIVIRQLPGFTVEHARFLDGIENREMRLLRAADIASEILLSPALNKCSIFAKRALANKFFGNITQTSDVVKDDTSQKIYSSSKKKMSESSTPITSSKNFLEIISADSDSVANRTRNRIAQSSIKSFFTPTVSKNATNSNTHTIKMDSYLADSLLVAKINTEYSQKMKKKEANSSNSTTLEKNVSGKVIKKKAAE